MGWQDRPHAGERWRGPGTTTKTETRRVTDRTFGGDVIYWDRRRMYANQQCTEAQWLEWQRQAHFVGADVYGIMLNKLWLRNCLEDEDPEEMLAIMCWPLRARVAKVAIGEAARLLLNDARSGKKPAPYLPRLLRLCQLIRLPEVQLWFSGEVRSVAHRKPAPVAAPADVLLAVICQQAGTEADWRVLLARCDVTSVALVALAPDLLSRLKFLATWWEAVAPEQGAVELSYLVHAIYTKYGHRAAAAAFAGARSDFPADLCAAIDCALEKEIL